MSRNRRIPLLATVAGLALLVLAVHWQSCGHSFVSIDDRQYVYENPVVRGGLTAGSASWAFTAFSNANWHPLTWLSHMADVSLFGLSPGAHHRTNVLLHLLNTVLLFLFLRRLSGGASWPSAIAAALFGVHPLHVESVAWVSERKDLLFTLFWILAMEAWLRYVRKPGVGRYLPVLLLFALSLMSKPMAVTLPFVLLLLDVWPLRRLSAAAWPGLILEKIPLACLSALSCVLTYLAQAGSGAVGTLEAVPAGTRAANAIVSLAAYLAKTAWPSGLAVFYPHPVMTNSPIPGWKIAASALLVAGATAVAFRQRARRPWLAFGWLWYLGTLVPVIGLVQVGSAAMADRYTYVPLIGIFLAVGWSLDDLAERRGIRLAVSAGAGIALAALSVVAWKQVGYWQDNYTLYSRAVAVTENNWSARKGLGVGYGERGMHREAVAEFSEALRLKPDDADTWSNLGKAQAALGRPGDAVGSFLEAVRLDPGLSDAYYNLGNAYIATGNNAAALSSYDGALRADPGFALAWCNRGVALANLGRRDAAIESYREALRRDDGLLEAWNNLGNASRESGQYEAAIEAYRNALRIRPDLAASWYGLGRAAGALGDRSRLREAVERLERVDPALARRLAAEAAAGEGAIR